MGTAPLLLTVFFGAMGSVAAAGGQDCRHHLHCPSGVPPLCVSVHPSLHV